MNGPDRLDLIRRDLAVFADPATPVQVTERGAEWHQRRRPVRVTFVRAAGTDLPDIQVGDRTYGYTEFFASEHMADLRALADYTATTIEVPKPYVQATARQTDPEEDAPSDALIRGLCRDRLPYLRTQVVFLRAPAGAGKTALLRHLAVEQAVAFREGRETFLYLYVDAQGRALSRLDEAIAAVLNDLRSSFTYHAVPALTRLGLLVPIIDGFDELLGVGGYQEAFSSLAAFLTRLEGQGALVASARASFYALSDLSRAASAVPASRANTVNYEISPIELLPWDDNALRSYLELTGEFTQLGTKTPAEGLQSLTERVGAAGAELLRTPFFTAAVLQLLSAGKAIPEGSRVLQALVDLFVEREVEKLRDKHGIPILSAQQHMRLLEMVADEMWWQGARELDPDTLTTIGELACDEFGISVESARALLGRLAAHALLSVQGSTRKLLFQHEYFYAYFLGRRLAMVLTRRERPGEFLGRAPFSPVVATETVNLLDGSAEQLRPLLAALAELHGTSMLTRDIVRSNLGLLYAALIREYSAALGGMSAVDAYFEAPNFGHTVLEGVTFEKCELRRPDFRSATWRNVRLVESQLMEPVVDERTTLGLVDVRIPDDVQGVAVVAKTGEELTFAPADVSRILQRLGATLRVEPTPVEVEPSETSVRHTAVLRRFLRMASRMFSYSDDDLDNKGLSKSKEWRTLEQLLQRHNLVEDLHIARRGPTGTMHRLRLPVAEIERAEGRPNDPTEVAALWRDIGAM